MRRTWTALAAALVIAGGLAVPAEAAATAVKVGGVRVSPARQAGPCPATTAFAAEVKVAGATRITYRWLRGDGSKGPVTAAPVKGGAVVVRDRRTFTGDVKGWQALQVLSPKRVTSAKARFSVSCERPPSGTVSTLPAEHPAPRASASLAGPAPYSGSCVAPGHPVTFTGTVRVSGTPASVSYRWVDDDGGREPAERLWFPSGASKSKEVTSRRTFLTSASGRRWLELLDARGRVTGRSNPAAYRVTCTSEAPATPVAAVTGARVSPAAYEGACESPVTFVFRADLAVTGPTKVAYQWVRGDGVKVPGTVELKDDLTTVLETSWQVTEPSKLAGGSARLQVLSPNATASSPAAFTITCRDEPVQILRAHILEQDNPNPCGNSTRNFSAIADVYPTKYATLPLTISYQWRWADGSHSAPRTHTFTRFTYVTAGQPWSEWLSKKGEVWLEVTAQGVVTRSQRLPYEVSCDGRPPTDAYPRVVSITEAAVTPSDYRGPCPVTLKARARITVSAPMDKVVVAQWMFPQVNQAAVVMPSFPAGGPLSKVVESDIKVDQSSTGTATGWLESHLPNLMPSNQLSYTVTCT